MSGPYGPMRAIDILDLYFIENRSRIMDIASFLDRIDRYEGAEEAKADFRYLKLEVYHYGQPMPKLKYLAASAVPHFLLFEATSDDKPYLFFGAAQYDLDMANPLRRVDASLFTKEQEAELSKRHTNPMRMAGSLSDYRNTLMRFGLGIVVLLVALVGIRLIRRRYF